MISPNESSVSPFRLSLFSSLQSTFLFLSLHPPTLFFLAFWCCLPFDINDRRHVSRHRGRQFGQFFINESGFSRFDLVHICLHNFFIRTLFIHTYTHSRFSLLLSRTYTFSFTHAFLSGLSSLIGGAIVKTYRVIQIRRMHIGALNESDYSGIANRTRYAIVAIYLRYD